MKGPFRLWTPCEAWDMYPWDHGALRPWGIETMGLWDYEIWDHGNFGPYDYMAKGTLVCFSKDFFI